MLDYKLIEAFALVVQEGGFDKAANALHITQSAVSQRVKLLEEQTGQILIVRASPPRATAAGRHVLRHYCQVRLLENDLFGEMDEKSDNGYSSMAVALNADSLATWFLDVIQPFISREKVLLDLRVDDQEETHRLLRDGEVVGCISVKEKPLQGCSVDYLGHMNYQMLASPEFAEHWFPNGLNPTDTCRAPAIIFNRKDTLHRKLLHQAFGKNHGAIPSNYIPSTEKFLDFIVMGLGYGMVPFQQSEPLLRTGQLVDLAPGMDVPVKLYWHRWNLQSELLDKLSLQIISKAGNLNRSSCSNQDNLVKT